MIAQHASPTPTSGSDADGWFTPGRFALLLAALVIVTFFGVVFGQGTFFYRDFGVFGYPLAHFQRECFWRGELPLWNPLNFCGMPFLAQWNTLTLYPPALFYLILPLSWSLGVFNLAHLLLAGLGMFFLARQWSNNSFAAAIAGVAFAFNGLTWHALMWPNDIAGLGWMPWVVWTVERAWREGRRRIVWAALAGALQMLSGAPEVILLTWVLVGLLCVTQLIRGDVPRLPRLFRFAGVIVLVAGLAAAQLLPFLKLLGHSQRDAGFSNATGWAMPLSGVANFVAPMFHCFQASQEVFMQRDQYWIASYYPGVGALLLALTVFKHPKKRRIWLLLAIMVFSISMALGQAGHLYPIIQKMFPAIGFMRYPIKFVVLAVFIIPLLAAYGMKRHSAVAAIDKKAQQKILFFVAALMLALLAITVWLGWKYPLNGDDWTTTWHNTLVRAVFIVLVFGFLLGMRSEHRVRAGTVFRIALLLLLWMDVRTHAPNLSPTVARSVYEEGLIRAELKLNAQAELTEPRFLASEVFLTQTRYNSVTNAAYDYLCRRLELFDDCNLMDGLPKVDGFYSLELKGISEVVGLLYGSDAKGLDLHGLKDFLGIAHVNPPGTNRQNALEWVDRANYLPLVSAGQQPYFVEATNSLQQLADPNFNPRETVTLPAKFSSLVTAKRAKAKLDDVQIKAQRITMNVEADAPTMVVVAQAFYSPWHAYVDGQRADLFPANHAFQALEVPAGKHAVKLVYEDRAFQAGLVATLVALLSLVVIWFVNGRA